MVNPEIAFLAAALSAPAADVKTVFPLVAEDLLEPGTRQVLDAINTLVDAGRPHDTVAVGDELQRRGLLGGHIGQQIKKVLLDAATAGQATNPLALRTYGAAVVADAYRHRFAELGKALVEAATDAAEHDLLPMLRSAGTDAVKHTKRLAALRGEQVPA